MADRLDALGTPHLRAAFLFVRRTRDPVTADEAARALGIHRNVARGRLERLAAAGLLETRFERRSGRTGPGAGRPAKLYAAAAQSGALEFPSHHFPTLVARLLDELPHERRERSLHDAGRRFGHDLARRARLRPRADLAAGLEQICTAVRSLGFHAALQEVHGDTAVIATPTCPLRPLVAERVEAATIDRGMWVGLVEHGLRGVSADEVACETHSCLESGGPCTVTLRFRDERARGAGRTASA